MMAKQQAQSHWYDNRLAAAARGQDEKAGMEMEIVEEA